VNQVTVLKRIAYRINIIVGWALAQPTNNPRTPMKKAIILLSGGLDSTTCLAIATAQGFECHALSFSYGQRHAIELQAAANIANVMGAASHHVIDLDTASFARSVLTNTSFNVPAFKKTNQIAATYVPARNTVFLAYALAYAETCEALDIFIGVSSVDYSGYPDCRPAFIEAFQTLANVATKAGVEGHPTQIHAPLLHLSKAQTLQLGASLGVDYGLTISCYQANERGEACGECDSCAFRKQGFVEAGILDPTRYV
jgi:7-cyano-7-deazaguanine synthase